MRDLPRSGREVPGGGAQGMDDNAGEQHCRDDPEHLERVVAEHRDVPVRAEAIVLVACLETRREEDRRVDEQRDGAAQEGEQRCSLEGAGEVEEVEGERDEIDDRLWAEATRDAGEHHGHGEAAGPDSHVRPAEKGQREEVIDGARGVLEDDGEEADEDQDEPRVPERASATEESERREETHASEESEGVRGAGAPEVHQRRDAELEEGEAGGARRIVGVSRPEGVRAARHEPGVDVAPVAEREERDRDGEPEHRERDQEPRGDPGGPHEVLVAATFLSDGRSWGGIGRAQGVTASRETSSPVGARSARGGRRSPWWRGLRVTSAGSLARPASSWPPCGGWPPGGGARRRSSPRG